MPQKPLTVAIIGGSLGGLMSGVVLKRLGHNVHIFERNPSAVLHDRGAGLVAGNETKDFFEKHDSSHHPLAIKSHLRHYLDIQGEVAQEESLEYMMTSWDLLYNILRANYDGTKSNYCDVPPPNPGDGEAAYSIAHTLTGIRQRGSSVELDYQVKDGHDVTFTADLVIAADGPSSTVRSLLAPTIQRTYTGYVAWRGTIIEDTASPSAREAFVEKLTYFNSEGMQILAYVIPGENGTLVPGKRLINWVWYNNYVEGSRELAELMTDKDGQKHRISLRLGGMREEIRSQQMAYARQVLPPQFAEIVEKTEHPFIQAITDVASRQISFFDGKVLLVGDAVCGFRPHVAASTSQAALHAQLLDRVFQGEMTVEEWEKQALQHADRVSRQGILLGERSQFGREPLSENILGVAGEKIGKSYP